MSISKNTDLIETIPYLTRYLTKQTSEELLILKKGNTRVTNLVNTTKEKQMKIKFKKMIGLHCRIVTGSMTLVFTLIPC